MSRDDRAEILAAVRRGALHRHPHPGAHRAPPLPSGLTPFAAGLAEAGGQAHGPVPREALAQHVAALARSRAEATGARIVASARASDLLGPLPAPPFETPAPTAAPHSFADVAVAILSGLVGVAESGAVAIHGEEIPERSLLVLCRHLILLLPEAQILPDLHQAFAALPDAALAHHHLTWICGPSKTADIEQTLVYGAHGPLTTDVVVFR